MFKDGIYIKCLIATISVADPHHFDADEDPYPDCHFYADADPACHFDAIADPGFYFDAVPDPDPSFQIKAQNLEKVLK
jgi:hypothetical protein